MNGREAVRGTDAMVVIDECRHCQHSIRGVRDELTNLTDDCGCSSRCNFIPEYNLSVESYQKVKSKYTKYGKMRTKQSKSPTEIRTEIKHQILLCIQQQCFSFNTT